MTRIILIVISIFFVGNASAGRHFVFKYNVYHKTGTANHKFVGQHSSRMPPSALNRYLSNPNVYAVPTNASSQYNGWHEPLGSGSPIRAKQSCNRGSAKQKAPVCR